MENNTSVFYEPIQGYCPICNHKVTRVIETDIEPHNGIVCESEYYCHVQTVHGDKLVKYKNPKHNYYGDNPDYK